MRKSWSLTPQGLLGPAVSDRVITVIALMFMVVLGIADSPKADGGMLVALTVAGWLPLLARHRWPFAVFFIVLTVECAHLVLVPLVSPVQFTTVPVATMVTTYTLGARFHWRPAWIYGAVAALVLSAVGTFARDGERLAANMFALDLVLGATGAGVLVRSRHQRLLAMQRRAELAEHTKEGEARRRVASERLRMARELHDVVAHHLTLVNAQSSVAEYLIRSDPEAAEKALQNLTEHTRLALDELRSTVGLLRRVDDSDDAMDPVSPGGGRDGLGPTPGLCDLPELIDRHVAMPGGVTLTVEGTSQPLSTITGLAAYRIIQEALTNARKHAPGCSAHVRLRWHEAELEICVSNDPPRDVPRFPGPGPGPGPGTGHGLLGMQERALASNGTLTANERLGGGWQVFAHLPTGAADQESK